MTIARRQTSTRFVKLHHEIAEMHHIRAPALLAYRGGDVFTTITDIIRNIPRGRSCSADSLEDLLKLYVPPPPSASDEDGCGRRWKTNIRISRHRVL